MRYREPTPCKQQSDKYRRSGEDVGSTEVQISQLSYRVKQLTAHLQVNKKDYATQRGLSMILGKRRRLLKYIQAIDRSAFPRPFLQSSSQHPMGWILVKLL